MMKCTECDGRGTVGYYAEGGRRPCTNCGGVGAVNDPQLERLIGAVKKAADELSNLRIIAEQRARREGH